MSFGMKPDHNRTTFGGNGRDIFPLKCISLSRSQTEQMLSCRSFQFSLSHTYAVYPIWFILFNFNPCSGLPRHLTCRHMPPQVFCWPRLPQGAAPVRFTLEDWTGRKRYQWEWRETGANRIFLGDRISQLDVSKLECWSFYYITEVSNKLHRKFTLY